MSLLVTPPAGPLDLPEPASLEDTGLTADLLTQLCLKMLHFAGELTGVERGCRSRSWSRCSTV
jgi:hypothetical protein